jgi:hypothetical protein
MEEIDKIEDIRRENNRLWMKLLRIAMVNDPAATKSVLKGISENDRKIFDLTEKLANG